MHFDLIFPYLFFLLTLRWRTSNHSKGGKDEWSQSDNERDERVIRNRCLKIIIYIISLCKSADINYLYVIEQSRQLRMKRYVIIEVFGITCKHAFF